MYIYKITLFDISYIYIVFKRQNLTSVDIRFWRLKSPHWKYKKNYGRRPIS